MPRPANEDELMVLEAVRPYLEIYGTEGWQRLVSFMDKLVEQAMSAVILNQSRTMDTPMRMRLQQRKAMREAVVAHVEGLLAQRRDILEALNEDVAEEVTW